MKFVTVCLLAIVAAVTLQAQQQNASAQPDPQVKTLVGRLELEKYKATIKGLTQFGDRLAIVLDHPSHRRQQRTQREDG